MCQEPARSRFRRVGRESGQASLLLLGVVGALLAGVLVLAAFGQALGAKGRHQRAADLAAMSAARSMSEAYPRLFESLYLESGAPNPRHLSRGEYVALARRAGVRAAARNGVPIRTADVRLGRDFAPTRVTVAARGAQSVRVKARG